MSAKSLSPNKVTEVSPGVFSWLSLASDPDDVTVVTKTADEIAADAKQANEAPHLGVYRWTRADGTFRGN